MNRWIKLTLLFLAGVITILVTLGIIGFQIHDKAMAYSIDRGWHDIKIMTDVSNKVLCPGTSTGLIVAGKKDPAQKTYDFYPVCSGLFDDASQGQWAAP